MKFKRKEMSQTVLSIIALVTLLFTGPTSVLSQTETGQVTVKSIDPQGAVVPGATVTAKSVERGTTLPTTTTNEEGVAVLTNMQPGLYEITVSGSGFAPAIQRIQVTVGAKLSVEVPLTAQAQSAVVNVVAGEGGGEVNTQTQELSSVVSTTQ